MQRENLNCNYPAPRGSFSFFEIKIHTAQIDAVTAYLVYQHLIAVHVLFDIRLVQEGVGMPADDEVDVSGVAGNGDVADA